LKRGRGDMKKDQPKFDGAKFVMGFYVIDGGRSGKPCLPEASRAV
jgi:hypothetical protein